MLWGPWRAAVSVLSLGLCSGCFVQLSAGVYSMPLVQGSSAPRAAASFGASAGFAYDFGGRLLVGPGGQGVEQPRGVTVTGPVSAEFGFGLPVQKGSRVRLRAGLGGSMQFATKFSINPGDGVLELRPQTLAHVYLPLGFDVLFGGRDGFFSAGLSVGPALFARVADRKYPDLFGPGGDLRLTLAVPLTPRMGESLAKGKGFFDRDLTPEEEAELKAAAERAARSGKRDDSGWRKQGDAIDSRNRYDACIRAGSPNCK